MIELKVHCDCGQKYKFDVEPVNGQMPFTVACPICKRDGTAKANGLLQQMSVFKMVEPPPQVGGASASAPPPPPIAPVPIAPPPPAAPGRLRINTPAHTESAPAAPPPIAATGAPPAIGARPRLGAASAAPATDEPGKKPSFALGLLGALIGATVGSTIYFLIFKTTGHSLS